jgi:hypothetical protein
MLHIMKNPHVCLYFRHDLEIINIKIQLSALCVFATNFNWTRFAWHFRGGKISVLFLANILPFEYCIFPYFYILFMFCKWTYLGILLGFLSFTLYYTCKTHRRSLYLKIEPHDPHSAFLYKGTIHFSNLFFLHRWEVSSLGILWIKELWTFMYMYLDAYKHVFLGRNISRNDVLGWVYL